MGANIRQALFGVLVASTTEGSGKISALISPEDDNVEEGGERFYSVRMRLTLRACYTGWCFRLSGGRLGDATGFPGVCYSWSRHIINIVGRATVFIKKMALG